VRSKTEASQFPILYDFRQFGDSLTAIEMATKRVVMNKATAIGVVVQAWSKAHMFGSYYGVMKQKYGDRVHMHYTDTDSYFLPLETEDLF